LAEVRFVQGFLQWSDDYAGAFRQAMELAQRSIALDSFNPMAHTTLSGVYDFTRHYDLSVAEALRAIAGDPNFAMAYSALAFVLCDLGRPSQAIPLIRKAVRLDPRRYYYYAFFEGRAYYLMGRYADAIPPLKINAESPEGGVAALMGLAFCYIETGRLDEARVAAAEIMRINPRYSLAAQKKMSPMQQPLRDRFYADLATAGLN